MPLSYDRSNHRLVYTETKATSDFWDNHWKDSDLKKSILSGKSDFLVPLVTKLFLKPGQSVRILEGGCGKGQYVYALTSRGYDAYGIDYAKDTIDQIKSVMPELKVSFGDVRNLPFPNDHFDGYWSLGVIEHFFEGYESIANEMSRVIKPGGYLFLTFPQLSVLRRVKARLGKYPDFQDTELNRSHFYQFALDYKIVAAHFKRRGFRLVFHKTLDGMGGLKRELGSEDFSQFFRSLEKNRSFFAKLVRLCLDIILAPFSGHTILLVLKKKSL
ncbi:MAG: methyltransferase domain-containing protein [Candidatus Moraniibacteriota bacterium]|nr:MAG: methyltransferase domain-containing protein [Candidatus Moranbacteria bacterium]